jgi:hypothetical protein
MPNSLLDPSQDTKAKTKSETKAESGVFSRLHDMSVRDELSWYRRFDIGENKSALIALTPDDKLVALAQIQTIDAFLQAKTAAEKSDLNFRRLYSRLTLMRQTPESDHSYRVFLGTRVFNEFKKCEDALVYIQNNRCLDLSLLPPYHKSVPLLVPEREPVDLHAVLTATAPAGSDVAK